MHRVLRTYLIAGFLVWIVLGYHSSEAQYTANFQTNIISAVTSNWPGSYIVGTNTTTDSLLIQNSGVLSNGTGYIGYEFPASNNIAVISGAGSIWSNRSGLAVGYSGGGNALVISNGGSALSVGSEQVKGGLGIGCLGFNSTSSNNSVLISDQGSVWVHTGTLDLGYAGAYNSLVVSNGGLLVDGNGYVGNVTNSISNTVLVTGPGSIWTNLTTVYIGYSGSGNSVTINNGGQMVTPASNGATRYVGYAASSSNNSILVSGAGSAWLDNGNANVDIGNSGPANNMSIRNGGVVLSYSSIIGSAGRSNWVLVADSGSSWTCASSLTLGGGGVGGSLVISNGGQVASYSGTIGQNFGGANNNAVVTGAASVWSNQTALYIGSSGPGNRLTIAGGGTVLCSNAYVGANSSSISNTVIVTDAESLWLVGLNLSIGESAFNTMVISNGAQVVDATAVVGNAGSTSSSNSVLVTDSGLWQTGILTIGAGAGSNSVVVAGGSVVTTNLLIGVGPPSSFGTPCDNLLELDGGTVTVTNSTGNAVLEVRHGTLVLNGGTLQVDELVMTNDCGLYVPNGGTLIAGSVLLNPNLSALGDGIPNGWKEQYGFNVFDPTVAQADTDGDGMSNLQEYLAGTDPLVPASVFRITNIDREGNDIRVMWSMGVGRTNALQAMNGPIGDATTNSYADIFTVTNALGSTTNYLDVGGATNGPMRFYRVRIVPAYATVHYVNINSVNPVSPYTNWATAATAIQDAVDVATNGDLVLVNDGTYQTGGHAVNGYTLTNRVAVTEPITVQSVNGPATTVIRGHGGAGPNAVRCVYLTTNATLTGFTLSGGATHTNGDFFNEECGGGVWCQGTAVVNNCMITGDSAPGEGGGAFQGIFNNCTITGNSCQEGAGAVEVTLNNCVVNGNSATWGGGAMYSTLNNCVISGNSASGTSLGQTVGEGGGTYQCTLSSCVLSNNSSAISGGGASYGTLVGCLVVGNRGGVEGGGVSGATVVNCTVIGNSVSFVGNDFPYGGGTFYGTVVNSILAYNSTQYAGPDYYGSTLSNCCSPTAQPGAGNITNDPALVNSASGDYHLQSNSPCINSGNNTYVAGTTDLDGNPRVVGGTVDIGAYEFQHPTSVISYAWLQQYGLPTDGSADFIDSDGDGMNNWEEWLAGTDPTNSSSSFRIISILQTNADFLITWTLGPGVANALQYASGGDYSTTNSFADIFVVTNMIGTVTNYFDSDAITNKPARFYRVRLVP